MTVTQLAFGLCTLTVFIVYWMNGQRQGRNLPPGPKKYPLIGSVLSMPTTLEWERYRKWGKEYSPLIKTLSLLHSANAIRRFRYYSCQRFRHIDSYLKLLQSRHRPSRPKIQYLLQQVSRFEYPSPRRIYRDPSLLQLDHTLPCCTNCKFLASYFEDDINSIWT